MKHIVQLLCALSAIGRVIVAQTLPGICGSQAKGALCPDKQCCSQFGFCGTTKEFCLTSLRCQSQCINDGPPPKEAGDIPDIDESKLFQPPAGTFSSKKLVGYFSNWAQYRGFDPSTPGCAGGDYAFLPENINPHLYTHINYAFVFMAENNSIVPHEHNDEELSLRMNRWIHRINPDCTTSVSVGGWSMNDGPSKFTGGVDYTPFFSKMAETAASRATFIQSAIGFARRLEFDGVDIDWEFIGDPTRGGKPADKENFNSLMREMRAAMQAEAASTGRRELMITMAAPAGPDDFKNIDAKTISDYVNWINLMTYDFYGNWNDTVENHAPIADTFIPGWSFTSTIDEYINAGVPPAKLMAGLPLYGRVWTLSNPSHTSPGAPGTAGTAGRCTAEHGYMAYFEIKEIADAQGGRGINFEPQDGYYMVFDDQWVGYDDEPLYSSYSAKVGIINDRGLGGAMLWAVDLDTTDAALTRKLLELYRVCPKDGVWPTTFTDGDAVIDCPTDSNKPGNTQSRHCNSDGSWGTVDAKSCSLFFTVSLASQQCIN